MEEIPTGFVILCDLEFVCENCGREATHQCPTCGTLLCDSYQCRTCPDCDRTEDD